MGVEGKGFMVGRDSAEDDHALWWSCELCDSSELLWSNTVR